MDPVNQKDWNYIKLTCSEIFLKLSSLLVSLSLGQIDNSVDNFGITASADWNAFTIANPSLSSAAPFNTKRYQRVNSS
ncbi:298_t:CDS:2 [Gigaspora margarita]|uniref:298_t:CDS:1 n=1 Tax=Gigaspora margarita TaxID=4874 RepID=A0ABM8W469_GIGMA|nr:298_t:CDS:2 [Gigaspora margarita]